MKHNKLTRVPYVEEDFTGVFILLIFSSLGLGTRVRRSSLYIMIQYKTLERNTLKTKNHHANVKKCSYYPKRLYPETGAERTGSVTGQAGPTSWGGHTSAALTAAPSWRPPAHHCPWPSIGNFPL